MFNLRDYEPQIREYMNARGVAPKVAVDEFIYNLIVMRPAISGFDEEAVNFYVLGQEWNKLLNDVRIAQKAEVIKLLRGVAPKTTQNDWGN